MTYHKYYVFISGLKAKPRYFDSRLEAEIYMHKICKKFGITVECIEQDKHERVYKNNLNNKIEFLINRQ